MTLNSASNRQVTLLRKLNRKKYRYKEQLFLIEGARAVQQILESGIISVRALFFDEDQQYWLQDEWRLSSKNIESCTLAGDLFAEVSDTDTPQGVLALCRIPDEADIDDLAMSQGIVIAFDAVQDPGNLGTIIRTATWFEASGILSGKGTVDLFHPKVVRGTAGATGTIPHKNGDLSEILSAFEEKGWSIFLLDAGDDAVSLPDIHPTGKSIIVVGNEAHGINADLMTERRTKVRIPSPQKRPQVESLNAGVAASIALYDLAGKQS
ncbi:MAG TPA: RNA methyltransferase [Balneolaceae bacterium]|nr:RNA methyltransferase [Balneolaceae bacterium]